MGRDGRADGRADGPRGRRRGGHRRGRTLPGRTELRHGTVAALAVALAATCLHALLTGNHWYAPVLLVAAVVAVVGAAARWARVPPPLVALVQLAAVLLTLTALYARGTAAAGFLPTPAALSRLGSLADDGLTDLRTVLFPTFPRADLELLCVGFVGVVAVTVDALAVGLRRPTFAGVPLLLLVAVPAAIRERSVGYLPLLAAVAGFLLLLSLDAEERTARWGRVLPGRGTAPPSAAAGNAGPALQIGLAALALAVVVPLAIPGATTSPFRTGGGLGSGSGGRSSAQIVDPLSSVSAQLTGATRTPLLTVRSPVSTYLRLTALESFTDAGFTLGPVSAPTSARVSKGIPPPTGVTQTPPSRLVTQTIRATDQLAENLLPVPDGTTSVKVDGDWRLSGQTRTIFSSNETTRGSSWTVRAALPEPGPDLLAAGGSIGQPATDYAGDLAVDLEVPNDLPPVLTQTAKSWIGGATTAYGAALAIQQHFTDGAFRYDTTVTFDPGPAGFTQFLAARAGFCEQYATTMAAMMRGLGVPARVAIGFIGGTPGADGSYTIDGGDAHAWPEVWFSTVGWVRFEPTPRTDGLAVAPSYAVPGAVGTNPTTTTVGPSADPSASAGTGRQPPTAKLEHQPGDPTQGGGGAAATTSAGRGSAAAPRVVGLLVAVLVVLLLALPGTLTAARRRRRLAARGPDAVEAVWAQLLADAGDRGVPASAGASPRATGRMLTDVLPAACAAPLGALVAAVERTRYAPVTPGRSEASAEAALAPVLADHERTLRQALDARLSRPRRLWVRLAPASGRGRVARRVAEVPPAGLAALDRLAGFGRRGRRGPRTAV